jgi:hypothetical protein
MSFIYAAKRGFAMGAKYGLVKGFRMYNSDASTPEMDETAASGAIGIIIAVGGVLIALYIIAVVVGSISYAVTSGNIKLSSTWNTTITNIDSSAQSTFNLAKDVMRSAKYSVRGCAADCNHRCGYPDDCDWGILRSGYVNIISGCERVNMYFLSPTVCRTLNKAIA